jgi:hypothetical protein
MLATLLVCFLGFTLLFAYMAWMRVRVERARDALNARLLAREIASDQVGQPRAVDIDEPPSTLEPAVIEGQREATRGLEG